MAKTGRKVGRNPYVHPDADKGMLNQAGNDGYSFDERDDPEPAPVPDFGAAGDVRRKADGRRFADLFRSSAAWQPPSGEKYLESGGKDPSGGWMNRPMRDAAGSRYCMPDTRHDLHDLGQFKGFMSMRAAQAEALSSDLAEYADLKSGAALPDRQERLLVKSFAERAVMALYGVDEGAHAGELVDYEAYCGELPYQGGRKQFERDLLSGDVNGVRILLDGFAGNWRRVAAQEAEAAGRGAIERTNPLAMVSDKTRENGQAVYTQEFLEYYVAEVKGREAFWDRCADAAPRPRPGIVVRETGGRVDFDMLRRVVGTCMLPDDGRVSQTVYGFDAGSILASARTESEPVKSVRYGLDAKAAEIESSGAGYREALAERYRNLSMEEAAGLTDEQLSDMALAAQEQAELD